MCGYEKIQETEYDAVVDTSEEWDIIFQTLKLTNYSLIVSEKTNQETTYAKCLVTEDNAMIQYAGENYPEYAIKNLDGTYNVYYYSSFSDKYYVEENTTDESYQEIVEESTLKFELVNYFDKFTYDKKPEHINLKKSLQLLYTQMMNMIDIIYIYITQKSHL